MKELNESELKQITGGDAADVYLATCAVASILLTGVSLVAAGPWAIAIGIIGGSLGYSTTVAGILKAYTNR